MRHVVRWMCVGVAVLASVGISAVSAWASFGTSNRQVARITVNFGSATGAGVVWIEVDSNLHVTPGGIVKTIDELPVTTVKVDGGGRHVLSVPITAAVKNAAADGYVNLQVSARFGDRGAIGSAWVELGNRAHGQLTTGAAVNFAAYYKVPSSWGAGSAAGGFPRCQWHASGVAVQTARIGELHAASLSGAEAQYIYGGSIDSQFGVVYSNTSSTRGFRESGAITLTGRLARQTIVTASDGTQEFVGARFIREEFVSSRNEKTGETTCGARYMAKFVKALAGAYRTGGRTSLNPFHGCLKDPGGYAEIAAGSGYYGVYDAPGRSYLAASKMFGVPILGRTNLTTTVRLKWIDRNPTRPLYVCGRGMMPSVPVYYESAS